MPRRQRWSPDRQIASEKPPAPLVGGCARCGARRTCIRVNGVLCCLKCSGCPWCGQVNPIVEEAVDDDLIRDPVYLGTRERPRPVRGDWQCLACSRTLVDWSGWRRRLLSWLRGRRAMTEGYKTRRKAA